MRPYLLLSAFALLASTAWADTRVDERHAIAPGGRIEISNIAGKVTVRGWDRNEVALTGSMADGLRLQQDKSTNRVRWEVIYPRSGNNGGATLGLRVPRSVEGQLGGRLERTWAPGGLRVVADLPATALSRRRAALNVGQPTLA